MQYGSYMTPEKEFRNSLCNSIMDQKKGTEMEDAKEKRREAMRKYIRSMDVAMAVYVGFMGTILLSMFVFLMVIMWRLGSST